MTHEPPAPWPCPGRSTSNDARNRFGLDGEWFMDGYGRRLILRGVNLGGTSKIPAIPADADLDREALLDLDDVSFVGRPFPLAEADEHFQRLQHWGFTILRFLVPWEAVEHRGPGRYDEVYLDYLRAVVERAGEHGMSVFIDPHQDTWSRWTGGDGAPAWTLEKLGIALERIGPTGAALLRQEQTEPFRRMAWPSNHFRYATSTLFTLFFAGNDFAPGTTIDGQPVQEFLQSHFIDAMRQVALRLRDLSHVIGFDSFNEPWCGFIGQRDLARQEKAFILDGVLPTPLEAMASAGGIPTEVHVHRRGPFRSRIVGRQVLNPGGERLFREGFECPWLAHQVWTADGGHPRLLQPDYFRTTRGGALADGSPPPPPGSEADFDEFFLKPFVRRMIADLRRVRPDFVFFLEGIAEHPLPGWSAADPPGVVAAFHWYDGVTLATKHYNRLVAYNSPRRKIELGPGRSFKRQLAALKAQRLQRMGLVPAFVGEFGVPFDLDRKRAYRTGDFTSQRRALTAYHDAIDENLLGSTIWNYSSDNTNERGDRWNDEDLSIFSRDQQGSGRIGGRLDDTDLSISSRDQQDPDRHRDIDSGGRALCGFCRPYAMKTAGMPLSMRFDSRTRRFTFRYLSEPAVDAPTEIYLPRAQYPAGVEVKLSGGGGTMEILEDGQLLRVFGPADEVVELTVAIRPGRP